MLISSKMMISNLKQEQKWVKEGPHSMNSTVLRKRPFDVIVVIGVKCNVGKRNEQCP